MLNDIYYGKTESGKINVYITIPGTFGGLQEEKIGIIKYNDNLKQYEFRKSFLTEHITHTIIQGLDKIMLELENH